jgi:hypothetical protein
MTRMSHAEYIASCDEEQLEHLVELANAKLKEMREAGWVKLWVVSDDWMNHGWFPLNDYAAALQFLTTTGLDMAAKGKAGQLGIRPSKFRPEEAAKLVAETRQELELAAKDVVASGACAKPSGPPDSLKAEGAAAP